MALGDNYNNNKKGYTPTVYSQYKMSNIESQVDITGLSASFWNNLLKLTISPMIKNGDRVTYDSKNSINIYLNHTKAKMFALELERFINNPTEFNNVGVNSGADGLIYICNGKEFGVDCPVLVIRKIDPNTGNVKSSYAYQFRSQFHYTIRNFESESADFDKVFYNNLEIEQLITLLKSYYESMTGALAYSVIENGKYDFSRINTKLNAVMDKLGVERKTGGSNYNGGSSSIFNNKEPRNFTSETLDDLESNLE